MSRTHAPSAKLEAYLAGLAPQFQSALEQLRATIRAAAPHSEEVFSYRMPAFRQDGILVYYGAFKDHLSFFPAGAWALRRKLARQLAPFEAGKGTLQFTPEHPIPRALVRRIVRARLSENLARRR